MAQSVYDNGELGEMMELDFSEPEKAIEMIKEQLENPRVNHLDVFETENGERKKSRPSLVTVEYTPEGLEKMIEEKIELALKKRDILDEANKLGLNSK